MELNYSQMVEATRTTVLDYAAQEWPLIKSSNGIQVSSHKEPQTPAKIYKAVCELNAPPSRVFEHVVINPGRSGGAAAASESTSNRRVQKSIKSWEVLKEFEENIFVLRSVSFSAGGGIISAREYFDLVGNFTDYDGGIYISCATGVDYSYPEDSKYVRGWNYPSGIMCFPVDGHPDKCRLVYIIHTDLKGRFPTRLVDTALPRLQVSFLSSLMKALKEDTSVP